MKKRSRQAIYTKQKITQKVTLRYATLAAGALALTVMFFVYLNFSQTQESKATEADLKSPDYTTVEANVPVRLLLKPEAAMPDNYEVKTDHNYKPIRKGRSVKLKKENYSTE